jgi:Fe2+ transport system protein FeoA
MSLLNLKLHRSTSAMSLPGGAPSPAYTLAELPAGHLARIKAYLPGMPDQRRTQLLAYGLHPGLPVSVRQHQPVIILLFEQTELALEWELAQHVEIEEIPEGVQAGG